MSRFSVVCMLAMAAVAFTCQPPDCDHPDCGTCGEEKRKGGGGQSLADTTSATSGLCLSSHGCTKYTSQQAESSVLCTYYILFPSGIVGAGC